MTKQTRSENTRLHLVRSAAELFDRNGFSGATLEDVSRSAGVTKGAFYFHFSSKDELGGAIQAEACGLLRAAVYRVVGSQVPALQAVVAAVAVSGAGDRAWCVCLCVCVCSVGNGRGRGVLAP